jgi:lipopolysaccharide export system permease protein
LAIFGFSLHRVILRELSQTFCVCACSLLSIILIGKGLQSRELFLGLDLNAGDTLLLFLYLMPSFLTLILPISCMLSVFLTFLRMSSDRELMALRANGISVYQILAAPALFSILCTGLAFFISWHGIVWGMKNFRATVVEIANTRARVVIQPGVFNQDLLGLTLFARQVDPVSGRLQEVIFEDKTQPENVNITILAATGEIITDEQNGQLVFNLENGTLYRVDEEQVSVLSFKNYLIYLDLSKLFAGMDIGGIRPKEMSIKDLRQINENPGSYSERFLRKAQVEIQKRWALPVSCLVLGIFAFPLACSFEGARRQLGIVLSLLFFLLYYSIFSLGLTMGEAGTLAPAIGLWLGNVLFALAAIFGMVLVARERLPSLVIRLPAMRWKKKIGRGNRPLSAGDPRAEKLVFRSGRL